VRSIYTGYLGWFDGDTANLSPASPDERAAGFAALAGGVDALLEAARQALEEERYAWAAELAAYAMRVAPERDEPRRLKARSLRAMGRRSISPNGRHYYLTQALELEDAVRIDESGVDAGNLPIVAAIPIGNFMAAMPVRLDAERARDVDLRVGFRFTDVGESFGIHVRRGVAELRRRLPAQPDVSLTTRTDVWQDIVTGRRNAAVAFASDAVAIEGSTLDLIRFLRLFQ
jgi:alkyl sulfatase BDS1-like metallo-beta-lactamase superfamily hydrolase